MKPFRRLSHDEQRKRFELHRSDDPVILERRERPKTSNTLSFRSKPMLYTDCDHKDTVLAVIRIPDALLPYCNINGWLASVETWEGYVVVVKHPSVEQGADAPVTPSNRCPECVLKELTEEFARIKADSETSTSAAPTDEPPNARRRRRSA
jgi:RNA polymerase subunit RPABC4/transcription elongation factor Spt4